MAGQDRGRVLSGSWSGNLTTWAGIRLRCPSSLLTSTSVPISEYSIAIRHSTMFSRGPTTGVIVVTTCDDLEELF